MLQAFKHIFPEANIDFICGNDPAVAELAALQPSLIRKIHWLPNNATWQTKMQFFKSQILPLQYKAIILPFDAQPNFLLVGSYMAKIPLRIAHKPVYTNKRTLFARAIQQFFTIFWPTALVPLSKNRHETLLNMDLLTVLLPKLGQSAAAIPPILPTSIKFANAIELLEGYGLTLKQYIVLQPCAANGEAIVKTWHPHNFAQLINKLQTQFGQYKIVLVGSAGDRNAALQTLLPLLSNPQDIVNTMGETNINQLLNLLQYARLVVCHDSGVMHFADALATPLLALYGPTDHTRTRPLRPSSHTLVAQGEWCNAMGYFALTEADLAAKGVSYQPLQSLSVEMVFEKIIPFLRAK